MDDRRNPWNNGWKTTVEDRDDTKYRKIGQQLKRKIRLGKESCWKNNVER